MRIPFLLCLIMLFKHTLLQAQTVNWEWAVNRSVDSLNYIQAPGVVPKPGLATDSVGNIYSLQPTLLKYTPGGSLIWAKNINAKCLAVDAAGNSYLTGTFSGTIQLDSITLTCPFWVTSIFIAKYNTNGQILWARKGPEGLTTTLNNYPAVDAHGISVDADGNFLLTGYCEVTSKFDHIGLINSVGFVGRCPYIAKFNSQGNVIWARIPANYSIPIDQVIAGPQGSYYATSGFDVLKYDANGNLNWQRSYNLLGTGTLGFGDIAVDDQGNCYASGPVSIATSSNAGIIKAVLLKFDPSGTLLWTQSSSNLIDETFIYRTSITATNSKVIMTGGFKGDFTFGNNLPILSTSLGQRHAFVASFSAQDGSPQLLKQITANGDVFGNAVVGLEEGCIVSGLSYKADCNFDNIALPSSTSEMDFFLARLVVSPALVATTNSPETFRIFPNPATDILTIQAPGFENGSAIIYNLTGQKVFESSIKTETKLNVADYPVGMYLIKLTSEGKTEIQKLIVIK